MTLARQRLVVGFNLAVYRRRNDVERTINRLKGFRAVATHYDKRTTAAIRLWPTP